MEVDKESKLIVHCCCKLKSCVSRKCACFKANKKCTGECSCYSCCNPNNDIIRLNDTPSNTPEGIRRSPRKKKRKERPLKEIKSLGLEEDKEILIRVHFRGKTQLFSIDGTHMFYFGELLHHSLAVWNLEKEIFTLADADNQEWPQGHEVVHELIINRPTEEENPKKRSKLYKSPSKRGKSRNYDVFTDKDGISTVYLVPKVKNQTTATLGKRRHLPPQRLSNTDNDDILSEPEYVIPRRKLPPRAARTIAKGRNRKVPDTHNSRRRRKKKSRPSIELEEESTDTDQASDEEEEIEKERNHLLLSNNLSFLAHKSMENLFPLFDDYSSYFPDASNRFAYPQSDPEAEIERIPSRRERKRSQTKLSSSKTFVRTKSESVIRRKRFDQTPHVPIPSLPPYPRKKVDKPSISQSLVPSPGPKTVVSKQKRLQLCLSIPITINSL